MKVADIIAERLVAAGARSVFAIAGASHTHVLDALDRRGVRIVSSRHESGAVSAADGYARATGRLGVALIIADQGLPNAIGGLAAAYHAGSRVLVLVASTPDPWVEPAAVFDTAKLQLVAPVSKWARVLPAAARSREYIDTAIAQATCGRAGPAVLLVAADLLSVDVAHRGIEHAASHPEPHPPQPHAAAIDIAAAWLAHARRPLILAGAGAVGNHVSAALHALAYDHAIPVTANSLGRGVLPEDGARSFSWPYAQVAAHEADCVLVLGSRLMQRQGFGLPPRFAADARFIQVDIAPEEAHRNRALDLFMHADAGATAQALVRALGTYRPDQRRGDWLRESLEPRRARIEEFAGAHGATLHPLRVGRLIMQRMPADSIYVGDGADIQNWMYGVIAVRRMRGFMDHYPLGAMGIGTALAVGAAAALAEESALPPPVVLVTGDGSFGFLAAELHAAARAGLRLIVVIGNDGAWGTELHEQRRAIGRALNTELDALPYELVAEGFGCKGLRAQNEDELVAALDIAFAATTPVVINALIDREAGEALKTDPLLRMILFSDLAEGVRALAQDSGG